MLTQLSLSKSTFFVLFFALFSTYSYAEVISEHITTKDAVNIIEQNAANSHFHILDVRTHEEFKAGHIANAVVIDFYNDNFASELQKLDKQESYLVYCRTGRRSANALELMKRLGFKEAYNMKGGITQWSKEGLPVAH